MIGLYIFSEDLEIKIHIKEPLSTLLCLLTQSFSLIYLLQYVYNLMILSFLQKNPPISTEISVLPTVVNSGPSSANAAVSYTFFIISKVFFSKFVFFFTY